MSDFPYNLKPFQRVVTRGAGNWIVLPAACAKQDSRNDLILAQQGTWNPVAFEHTDTDLFKFDIVAVHNPPPYFTEALDPDQMGEKIWDAEDVSIKKRIRNLKAELESLEALIHG